MSDDQSGFCTSLQSDWSIDELTCERGQVTIRLSAALAVEYPKPMGRAGHLVMAEPAVFRELQSAEIRFKSVLWCQAADDLSFAASEVGQKNDEKFDGSQFRCYSRSRLLTQQRGLRPDPEGARIKHYQLVTIDEVIDIVSTEAPEVVIRTMVPSNPPTDTDLVS